MSKFMTKNVYEWCKMYCQYIMNTGDYPEEYDDEGNQPIDDEYEQQEELKRVLKTIEPFFNRVADGKEIVKANPNFRGLHTLVNRGHAGIRDIIGSIITKKNALIETYRFLSTFPHNGVRDPEVKKMANIQRFIEPYTLIHQLSRLTTKEVLNQYKYKFVNVQQKIPFTDIPTFYLLKTPIYLSQEDVGRGITIIIKSPLAAARQSLRIRQEKISSSAFLPGVGNEDLTHYLSPFLDSNDVTNGPITDLRQLKIKTTYLVRSSRFTIDGSMEKFICTFDGVETPSFTGGKHKRRVHKTKRNRSK